MDNFSFGVHTLIGRNGLVCGPSPNVYVQCRLESIGYFFKGCEVGRVAGGKKVSGRSRRI